MTRIGGSRRKKSGIFTKSTRKKGKISHNAFLQEFKEGEKVVLKMEPGVQKGLYLPRFHGKIGTVVKRKGSCYYVEIKDGSKYKHLISHPVHLKRVK